MATLKRFSALLLFFVSVALAQDSIIGGIIGGIGDTLGGILPGGDPPGGEQPPHNRYCDKGLHIIGVRGHGQQGQQPYGNLTSAIVGIKERIPHSTNDTVDYPRDPPPSPNAVGGQRLLAKIKQHAKRCPKMPMLIIGYSQGAIISMNTVCGGSANTGANNPPLDEKYLKQIAAVTVYGDETRTYGQPYNRGTCLSYGTYRRLNPQGCMAYSKAIRSWCDKEDPLCCEGGVDRGAHTLYPSKYDDNLINFVVKRFKKKKKTLQQ